MARDSFIKLIVLENLFMARKAIPIIAFPRVQTIYIYIYIYIHVCLCHLREYALYT